MTGYDVVPVKSCELCVKERFVLRTIQNTQMLSVTRCNIFFFMIEYVVHIVTTGLTSVSLINRINLSAYMNNRKDKVHPMTYYEGLQRE